MVKRFRLSLFGYILILSGCGDLLQPIDSPDSGPPVTPPADAGPPDAVPIDAPPPWEPPDPVIPGEPCTILDHTVSAGHEAMYDDDMANYSVRFKDGQGLEDSPDLRQMGLLEAEDAHVDNREVLEKRRGADELGDSRGTLPGAVVPLAARRAVWSRGEDTILETDQAIYRRNRSLTSFTWDEIGPWTRTRLREDYANVNATSVVNADHARLDDVRLIAVDAGSGAQFGIYNDSQGQEAFITVDAAGVRPRLSMEGDQVRFSYVDAARAIRSGVWPTGLSSMPTAPIGLTLALGRLFWDVTGIQLDTTEHVSAWIGTPNASASTLIVSWDGATPGSITRALPLPLADIPTTDDNAVVVFPMSNGNTFRVGLAQIYLAVAGNRHKLFVEVLDINKVTSAVTLLSTANLDIGPIADFARAVALSWESYAAVHVAVEQEDGAVTHRKVTYYRHLLGGALTFVSVHYNTALVSQGAIIAGTPTLDLLPTDPLTSGFVELLLGGAFSAGSSTLTEEALYRNGMVMYAPRTGEVIARSFVGFTGNLSTRITRPAKGSLIAQNFQGTWAAPASIQAEPAGALKAIAVCRLDTTATANEPAFVDLTAVSAHGGYPRGIDGVVPFEHDWHTIPRITLTPVRNPAAGFTGGVYTTAITWEWDDANGVRYRSAPYTFQFDEANPFDSLAVSFESLTHTERPNTRVVVWMTDTDGETLHRWQSFATSAAARTQTVTALFSAVNPALNLDPLSAREVLDQAPTPLGLGVLESRPARVTDFIGFAVDRLFSRDPLKGSLARFTIPSREATGYAMHWPLSFAIEEPDERDVTGVVEMDGRIIVGSRLGLALLTADGPDATGAGSFGQPTILRAELGIADQAQLTRTPLGYAFGTADGPRLLNPGLVVDNLGKAVERNFKIDGANIVSIVYDQNREEMVFLSNAAKTLRLNTGTGRWVSDSNRLGRDMTVTKDGTLYLIRSDGKVLKQREDVWADGGVGYALKVSTPWIRDMVKDGTTHSAFRLNGFYVSGEYLGPHDLFFDVYKDFDDVTPWGTFQVPEATVVANNAANRGWIYGVRLGGRDTFLAARIVVRDGAEPNQTFRLAQMDIDVQTNGSSAYAELPTTHYAARV
jgi:hypothetical protein